MNTPKWAVETIFFDDGTIESLVREARKGEKKTSGHTSEYDFYLDLFDTEGEALAFADNAKTA